MLQCNNSASGKSIISFGYGTKPFVVVQLYLWKSSDILIFKILAYTLFLSCRHFVAELSIFVKSHRRSK